MPFNFKRNTRIKTEPEDELRHLGYIDNCPLPKLSELIKKYSPGPEENKAHKIAYLLPIPRQKDLIKESDYSVTTIASFLAVRANDNASGLRTGVAPSLGELINPKANVILNNTRLINANSINYLVNRNKQISQLPGEKTMLGQPNLPTAYDPLNNKLMVGGGGPQTFKDMLTNDDSLFFNINRFSSNGGKVSEVATTIPQDLLTFFGEGGPLPNPKITAQFLAHPLEGYDSKSPTPQVQYPHPAKNTFLRPEYQACNVFLQQTGMKIEGKSHHLEDKFQCFKCQGLNRNRLCVVTFSLVLIKAKLSLEGGKWVTHFKNSKGEPKTIHKPIMVGGHLLDIKMTIQTNVFTKGQKIKRSFSLYDGKNPINDLFIRQYQSNHLCNTVGNDIRNTENVFKQKNMIDCFDRLLIDYSQMINRFGLVIFMPIICPWIDPNLTILDSKKVPQNLLLTEMRKHTSILVDDQKKKFRVVRDVVPFDDERNRKDFYDLLNGQKNPFGQDPLFREYFNKYIKIGIDNWKDARPNGDESGRELNIAYKELGQKGQTKVTIAPYDLPLNWDVILHWLPEPPETTTRERHEAEKKSNRGYPKTWAHQSSEVYLEPIPVLKKDTEPEYTVPSTQQPDQVTYALSDIDHPASEYAVPRPKEIKKVNVPQTHDPVKRLPDEKPDLYTAIVNGPPPLPPRNRNTRAGKVGPAGGGHKTQKRKRNQSKKKKPKRHSTQYPKRNTKRTHKTRRK